MGSELNVFREYEAKYEHVGTLFSSNGEAKFVYAAEYLASPHVKGIATILPLQSEAFSEQVTRCYFEGLLPEGSMRRMFVDALRIGSSDSYPELLAALNNESSGALVFGGSAEEIAGERAYAPFRIDDLQRFSASPHRVAVEFEMTSRLSIAGAQNKMGLYLADVLGDSLADYGLLNGRKLATGTQWYLPKGSAPSTHIIKAADEAFPLQTINEAFCLATARHSGFEVADSFIIDVEQGNPLLAVARFDRDTSLGAQQLEGLTLPRRLHQEDFCQAAGLLSWLKYEPTDGHYLALATGLIERVSVNPFGNRMEFFGRILFDFLIGNCDNHLKNHSFLWSTDWSTCELSPMYDITCTTMYPNLAREMGVSLCPSRRIDDVTKDDIVATGKRAGISSKMACQAYGELAEQLPVALAAAEQELAEQGFDKVSEVASFVRGDSTRRMRL